MYAALTALGIFLALGIKALSLIRDLPPPPNNPTVRTVEYFDATGTVIKTTRTTTEKG